jgi:hypothetical protein
MQIALHWSFSQTMTGLNPIPHCLDAPRGFGSPFATRPAWNRAGSNLVLFRTLAEKKRCGAMGPNKPRPSGGFGRATRVRDA